MRNLVVFAGSGTSLGAPGGPSMSDLWEACVKNNSDGQSKLAGSVIEEVSYDIETEGNNIETLLSRCDAYQDLFSNEKVAKFVLKAKTTILEKCSSFISENETNKLAAHRKFLLRMSRRRARDPRLKVFTTNYDLCFEMAAAMQRLVVIDGFSFSAPRYFDPSYFHLDIVRRRENRDDIGTPLEGVFCLYKIHGSVNWRRTENKHVKICDKCDPGRVALVYPAAGKYRQSYTQPHLEMISQYFAALREPNTCVVIIGFGFRDSHLTQPVLSATKTNPNLRLLVVNSQVQKQAGKFGDTGPEDVWGELRKLAEEGEDVWLINATFGKFAEWLPDLKALSPSQRLRREIEAIAGKREARYDG